MTFDVRSIPITRSENHEQMSITIYHTEKYMYYTSASVLLVRTCAYMGQREHGIANGMSQTRSTMRYYRFRSELS